MRKYFIENISCSQKRGIFFILLDSASSRAKTKATAGIKRRYLETSSATTTLLPFIAGEGMLLAFLAHLETHEEKIYLEFAKPLSTNQNIFLVLDLEPNVMLTMRNASQSKFWILKDNLQNVLSNM